MSWSAFLEPYGFEWQKPALRDVGLEGTHLWRRGELRLLLRERPFRIFQDEGGLEILFKDSYEAPYESLERVLDRIGIDWQRDADSPTLLGRHMDHVLAYFTYKFLLDRGFAMVSNDNRGGGRYTLVFRRGDLDLRIDVDGDDERIDLNGVPLADVLRAKGIEGNTFADLREHIDAIPDAVVTVTPT